MWSSVKTEGIVLTVAPWREADRRYRVLTPGYGKVECIGRGALKPKAKLSSHLEPCAILELEIIRGGRGATVIGVERLHAFRHTARSIDHRLLALTSMALLDKTTQLEEEDVALYDELTCWLHFLEGQEALHATRSTLLLGSFLLRLMRHLGYDTTLLREAPRTEGAVALLALARDAEYADLFGMPLSGRDVEGFAAYVHGLLAYHVPGYADRPFWVGIMPTRPLRENSLAVTALAE